jgi:hypothetical protein
LPERDGAPLVEGFHGFRARESPQNHLGTAHRLPNPQPHGTMVSERKQL